MKPTVRRDNIYIEKLAGETVLYDKSNHRAHCLNATMAAVWQNADGTNTIEMLAGILHQELAVANDRNVVLLALEQLDAAGLLTKAEEPMETTDLPTRRNMARKLALAGMSIPMVASVLAPTPAMAASGKTYSAASFGQNLKSVNTNIENNPIQFAHNGTAQIDYANGIASGDQGIAMYMKGNNTLAQADFKASESDFDGVLKALGLPPL